MGLGDVVEGSGDLDTMKSSVLEGQRRGLNVMEAQVHLPDGQVWLCERCSRDILTV